MSAIATSRCAGRRTPAQRYIPHAAAFAGAAAIAAAVVAWPGSASSKAPPITWSVIDASVAPVDPPYVDDGGPPDADAGEFWSCDACARTSE